MEKKISFDLDETQLDHIVMSLNLVQELAKRPWWVDVQVCQDLEARLLDAGYRGGFGFGEEHPADGPAGPGENS